MSTKISFKSNRYYFLVSYKNDKNIKDCFNSIVKVRCDLLNLYSEYIDIKDGTHFINTLSRIEEECKLHKSYPYLHIECHGSEYGIKLLNSEIRIPWSGIAQNLQKINVAAKNNLVISMASCFGGHLTLTLFEGIKANSTPRSIVFAIIGPEKTINDGQLEEGFVEYFNELLSSRDLGKAFDRLRTYSQYEGEYIFDGCINIFKKIVNHYIEGIFIQDFSSNKNFRNKLEALERQYTSKAGRQLTQADRTKMIQIVTDKSLYLDYLKELRDKYFMVDLYPNNNSRFPQIGNIDGFDQKINQLLNTFIM